MKDEIVLISGVSGQLGSAYARAFLQAGAQVAGGDIQYDAAIAKLEAEYPDRFQFVECDITSEESLKVMLREVEKRFAIPTVLINNAAIDSPPHAPAAENGIFEEYPRASWEKILEVNVTGTFLSCQIIGGAMAAAGRGSIVNISSIYGVVSPDQSLYQYRRDQGDIFFKPVGYSVSKSAILNLTRYLATYWAKDGVRVNTLVIAGVANNQDKDFLDAYCKRIPIGRMATETDYNGAVLFLSSPASIYMTGAQLVVDGGWTAI